MSNPSESNGSAEQASITDESLQHAHAHLLQHKPDEEGGYPLIPIGLVFLFGGLFFFASLYLTRFSGRFDALVYDERKIPALGGAVAAQPADPLVVGERLYNSTCAVCHQATGAGVPAVFPPLAGSDWVTGPEERVIAIVIHGVTGPIEVAGQTYNSFMPPLGGALDDSSVAAISSYIRQAWGNAAPAVTPERVAEVRAATAGHTGPYTADELSALGQ